jgi:glucans biosynthesis protein
MTELDRRMLLAALSASLMPQHALAAAAAPAGIRLGPPRPFSFSQLVDRAQKNASQPYKAPPQRAAEIIKTVDYDAAQKIKFKPDHAYGPTARSGVVFHLSRYANEPVVLHTVDSGRRAKSSTGRTISTMALRGWTQGARQSGLFGF